MSAAHAVIATPAAMASVIIHVFIYSCILHSGLWSSPLLGEHHTYLALIRLPPRITVQLPAK